MMGALAGREELNQEVLLDGFDNSEHEDEVARRWSADAHKRSEGWGQGLMTDGRRNWQTQRTELTRAWITASQSGMSCWNSLALSSDGASIRWERGGTENARTSGCVPYELPTRTANSAPAGGPRRHRPVAVIRANRCR